MRSSRLTWLTGTTMILMIALLLLMCSCTVADKEVIERSAIQTIEKYTIDSVHYIIVRTDKGVAIIKHEPLKSH